MTRRRDPARLPTYSRALRDLYLAVRLPLAGCLACGWAHRPDRAAAPCACACHAAASLLRDTGVLPDRHTGGG